MCQQRTSRSNAPSGEVREKSVRGSQRFDANQSSNMGMMTKTDGITYMRKSTSLRPESNLGEYCLKSKQLGQASQFTSRLQPAECKRLVSCCRRHCKLQLQGVKHIGCDGPQVAPKTNDPGLILQVCSMYVVGTPYMGTLLRRECVSVPTDVVSTAPTKREQT